MSSNNKIKVAIKSRPLLKREIDQKLQLTWKIKDNTIREAGDYNTILDFDHIFDEEISTQEVFDVVGKPIVDQAIKGFNGTIFAYGQTASGKTHTMLGDDTHPGVMVLAAKEIFKKISQSLERMFLLRVGYIELYNERIYDLLGATDKDNKQTELKIHESSNGEVNVNCIEHIIKSEDEMIGYLYAGNQKRKIGETKMNERSSRSHSIFRIIIESREMSKNEEAVQISVLNLVDLAGSEKASQTGATGLRLKEGSNINKSLLFLGQVINQLAEPASADKFISYRDSKLTRILQASLGGNALTAIICTINPTALDETQSTLNFALRAKCIDNKPKKNEVVSDSAMMKRLEKEVTRLKNELEMEKARNGKIKIAQLESRINEENLKMLNASTIIMNKDKFKAGRRRTWCPTTYGENIENIDDTLPPLGLSNLPAPNLKPQKSQISRFKNFLTPQVFNRDFPPPKTLSPSCESLPSLEDIEFPDNNVTITSPRTPSKTPTCTECGGRRSIGGQFPLRVSLTPVGTRERFKVVEEELDELKEFSNLEKDTEITSLRSKVAELENSIDSINKERVEFEQAVNRYTQIEQKNNELSELNEKLKKQNAELEQQNREAVSLEFEFKRLQGKAKQREDELLELVEERDKNIQQLETDIANILKNPLKSQKSAECLIEKLEREKCQIVDLELRLGERDREILELNKKVEEYSDIEKEKMEISMKYELEHSRLEKENEDLKLDVENFLSEINSMKQMASIFETELNAANTLLKESQEQTESLKKELEVIKAQQESLEKEKEQLQSEYEETSDQIMTYLADNEKLMAEIEDLKKKDELFNDTQIKYKKVVEEMEELKSNNIFEYEQVLNEREKLTTELAELSSKYQSLLETSSDGDFKEKYETERMEKEKLLKECEDLKTHVSTKTQELESLQNDKDEAEKMNEILILDKETIQEEKETLEQQLREMKDALQTEQTNLVNLKESHKEVTVKFEEISIKHEETISEKANLVKSLDSLKTEYSELSESTHGSQSSTGDLIESFNDKLNNLREIEIVTNDESRVYKTNELSSKESSHLRLLIQDFVNVRQTSCTLMGEGYVISGKIQELPFSLVENQQLNNMASEDSLKVEYDELREKYEQLSVEISGFHENSSNEKMARRRMEERIQSLEQMEQTLKDSLVEVTTSHDSYKDSLEQSKLEVEQLTVECDKWRSKCSELAVKADEMVLCNSEAEELEKKVQELLLKEKECDELKAKFEECFKNYESCKLKVKEMEEQRDLKENSYQEVLENCEEFRTKYEESLKDFDLVKSNFEESQKTLENKQNAYKQIAEECEEWKVKYEESLRELESKTKSIQSLEENIQNLKEEISLNLDEQLKALENKNSILENSSDILEKRTSELEDLLSQNTFDLEKKTEELQNAITLIEQTEKGLHKASDLLESKNNEFLATSELLAKKTEELETSNTLLEEARKELQSSSDLLEQTKGELQSSSELVQQKSSELQTITELLEQNKKELESFSDLLEKANQRESELEREFESLRKLFESLNEKSLEQQNSKIVELQEAIEEFSVKEQVLQKELSKGHQHVEDLMNQINVFKEEISKHEAEGVKTAQELKKALEKLEVSEQNSQSKDNEFENLYREASNYQQNLKSLELESEDLRNNLETLKISNVKLDQALNEKQKEFEDITRKLEQYKELEFETQGLRNHLETLKVTNSKLDQALNDKQKEFDEIARKLEDFERMEKELTNLKNEKKESQQLQLDLEVLEMSCKELEASQQCLRQELAEKDERIKVLQKTIEDLQTTKKIIESKMKTSEHSLRQQINNLQEEKENLLRRSKSPLSNGTIASPSKQRLLDENDTLKKKNHNLCVELDKEKKLTLSSRKSRRQSTHDERRSYSNCFGSNNDVEIQTDPSNESCNCTAMNVKIKDLERKLLFSTKAVECMKMEKKTDPLKEENSKLKKTIEEMESKQTLLRYEIKKQREAPPPSQCKVCLENKNKIIKDSFTEPELTMTELEVKEAELKKMNKKIDDLKYVCRERKRRNDEFKQELEGSMREKAQLEFKYKQLKVICESRFVEIQELKGNSASVAPAT